MHICRCLSRRRSAPFGKRATQPKKGIAGLTPHRHRTLPDTIRGFWFWILSSALITLGTTYYYRHFLHKRNYPFGNPWFQIYSFQFDFKCHSERIKYFHTERFFHQPSAVFNYPALLALVYKFFYSFGSHAHTLFITTLIFAFSCGAILFGRALLRRGVWWVSATAFVLTVVFTSHPLGVLFYLANMEGIVWIATSLGVYTFVKNRYWLAAFCFGIAAAMKIFPIIYLGLLWNEKRYKQLIFGTAVCVAVSIASLAILGPTIASASKGLAEGIQGFNQVYVKQWNHLESGMDHSLFAFIKICLRHVGRLDLIPAVASPYMAAVGAFGVALYIGVIRRLPRVNAILALAICAVLFPQVSHDYTLVHLYAPWALLTLVLLQGNPISDREARGIRYMMACFVILFTSQNYLISQGVSFAGQVKCVALVILLALACVYHVQPGLQRAASEAGA